MDIRSLCGLWEHGVENGVRKKVSVPGNRREYVGFESYSGPSVYSVSFELSPEDSEKHLELWFSGIRRTACVRVNGQTIARHLGSSPFRADVTGLGIPGTNLLEVTVDDRDPTGLSNAALFDIIPLPLYGIFDSVRLCVSEHSFVRGIYAPVDLEKGIADLRLSVFSRACAAAELRVRFVSDGATALSQSFAAELSPGESELSLPVPLSGLRLWSPDDPALYTVEVTLTQNGRSDSFSAVTGLKSLDIRGRDLYLNGKPTYMLGYGDDFVWPDGAPCGRDADFFAHGILRAKEYGFIFARHHSHFPFEAFLEAADRLGLLIQPELELANVPRESLNSENKEFFLTQWRELILANRHHPCIALWCGGNEMEWGYPFDAELYATAKELDPYRPATSTDGHFMACDVTDASDLASVCPAEYTDYLPIGELSDMFTRDDCGKPQFVHEMGNYATLPDPGTLPLYENARIPPQNTLDLQKTVRDRELAPLLQKALPASRSLQKLCHKLNVEKARLSPFFSGYHLWTLTDFYNTSQGLLDRYFGDKAFTAPEFRAINSQEVLLWDRERDVFRSGERTELGIVLSRYGSDEPFSGRLTLKLSTGDSLSLSFGAEGHGLFPMTVWELTLPEVEKEERLTLSARFEQGSSVTENSWELFVCPRVAIGREREIYLNYVIKYLFQGDDIPTRHFTVPQPIGEKQLIVTEFLYGGMTEAVERGANLLLFAGNDTFRGTAVKNSFKCPWWDIGEIWYLNHTNNSQVTGIAEPGIANGMLPYHGCWRTDLFYAVEQAPAVCIDELGMKVTPLIYGVDRELRRRAYLFSFRMGKGNVTVCTLNHSREHFSDPSVEYFIKSVINYAMSPELSPEEELTPQEFSGYLK